MSLSVVDFILHSLQMALLHAITSSHTDIVHTLVHMKAFLPYPDRCCMLAPAASSCCSHGCHSTSRCFSCDADYILMLNGVMEYNHASL